MNKDRPVSSAQQEFTFTRRAMFVGGVQGAFGLLLAGRMAFISVAENEKYKLQAEKQPHQPDADPAASRLVYRPQW